MKKTYHREKVSQFAAECRQAELAETNYPTMLLGAPIVRSDPRSKSWKLFGRINLATVSELSSLVVLIATRHNNSKSETVRHGHDAQ